jgi:hypothetical protein
MPRRALALAVLIASTGVAHALTLENPFVYAMLVEQGPRDPFRIRARLSGVDVGALASAPVTVRFGPLIASIPAGGFRRRKGTLTWKSYVFGVKKVTIRVRSATLEVVGGDTELGALPGPVTLALEMPGELMCGRVIWTDERVMNPRRTARRAVRKMATGPLEPCTAIDGTDRTPPQVTITSPTGFEGVSVATSTISLGGLAVDNEQVSGLTWSSDHGGGGSLPPSAEWSIPGVTLQPGDNRITVSATDPSGNVGTDVIDVTYNVNGIVFDGLPVGEPAALFAGQSGRLAIHQSIVANPDLDPSSVRLERLSDTGATTTLATMVDDGNLAVGDEIQGDSAYTGKALLAGSSPGLQRLRVSARTFSQPDLVAWSPVLTFPIVEHVTQAQLDAAIALANDARALLASKQAEGASTTSALGEVIALAFVRGARAAGPSEGGLGAWWVDVNGLLAGVLAYDQGTLRGGATGPPVRTPLAPPRTVAAAGGPPRQVDSRRTIILSPYFSDQEPDAVASLLGASLCPLYEVESYTGTDAGAERFATLDGYGMVLITSHGETFFQDVADAYRPEWGWSSAGAQVVVLTGTTLAEDNLETWERDLRLGRMAVMPDGVAAILPAFVTGHNVRFPSSIVYVGACRSSSNITMASAFFGRGARTYFGYDGYVASGFARDRGVELFTNLLAGNTSGQSFTPGLVDAGSPPSALTMEGDADTVVSDGIVLNGGFEAGNGFAGSVPGFGVAGDGRVVGGLGSAVPTEGQRMALISTGLGFTTAAGSIAQPVCLPPLPPGMTKWTLSYDWNFFSEEFLEFCGSIYQDSFQVEFAGNVLQSSTIDDLCGSVTPADVKFDKGGVYKTGWRTQTVDLTPFAGTSGMLSFAAHDVGDSIFDSAILIDRVQLVAEP